MNILRPASLVLVVVVAFASAACSASSDTDEPSSSSGTTSSSGSAATLDGSYSGTYSGSDNGPVTMTVSGSKVDVVATVSGKSYPGSGEVGPGGVATVGLGAGDGVTVTFDGTFANGKGSGTWKSTVGGKGTWSVAK